MRAFLHATLLAFISIVIFGCSKSPVSSGLPVSNYMPLNEGDIRQFVFHSDSSTSLWRTLGKTKRKDGYDVFIIERTSGTENPDTSYFCLRDGYFTSTLLDTTNYLGLRSENPFFEQRLARLNPTNGEQWDNIIGLSDSTYFIAAHFEQKTAICGNFPDVYGFTLAYYSNGALDTIVTPFYAPNIGLIGSDIDKNLQPDLSASYLKIGNIELGKLWPAKNPTQPSTNSKQDQRKNILRSIIGIY